ncbi:Nicotianamine synthase [Mollisia scopiformis]|uniref:Nicotianamine synthase n=1 Tax=Mollisia scopiformis TaxID=149040 RepID=A0A132B3Y5_MOLSC|nr:Nicotianamine synthase [Mollisia scopiformis]KUJ06739.1 Nicotianamine synthase [Mollisia scopiformis]
MASLWSAFVSYFSAAPAGTLSRHSYAEAERIVLEVLDIYKQLKAMKSLKPCDEVDGLFERLVDHSILNRYSEVTDLVLQDPKLLEIRSDLRKVCDVAECCLEFHWADIIIGQGESSPEEVFNRLKLFPYFENYVDLTKLELSAIYGVRQETSPISRVAFLGSGPLPLTSLCLCGVAGDPLQLPGITAPPISVLNIDIDTSAISKSKVLCEKLGDRGKRMDFICSDARNPDIDLTEFDVVYLAALVGSTQKEKEEVLVDVVSRMSENALLVIRSADRLRRLLYPVFDPSSETVTKYLDICAVVHPYNHVVNSVVIGRVRRREMERIHCKL